jgi:K+-sensing histidine kinase KdpD
VNSAHSAELFRVLAHRLRMPLGGILELSDLIILGTEGEASQVVLEDVHQIRAFAAQVLETMDSVLDLVRVESMTARMTPMRLPLILQHAQEDARGLAVALNRYVVNLVPDDVPEVWADGARILKTLTGLLGVMIRISQQEAVNLRAYVEDGFAVVRFWEGRKNCAEGSTLSLDDFLHTCPVANLVAMDLLIAARVAARHGGDFWLSAQHSKKGQSVSIFLSLPLASSPTGPTGKDRQRALPV